MNEHISAQDDSEDEAQVEAQLLEAVENQLAAGEPAYVQAVYNKLTLVGYPRAEILELMAQVLAYEIQALMQEERSFDHQNYEALLRQLPQLPDTKEN